MHIDDTQPTPLPHQLALRLLARGRWAEVDGVPGLSEADARILRGIAFAEILRSTRELTPEEVRDDFGAEVEVFEVRTARGDVTGSGVWIVDVLVDQDVPLFATLTAPDGSTWLSGDFFDSAELRDVVGRVG